jgi:hypothetical protein
LRTPLQNLAGYLSIRRVTIVTARFCFLNAR